MDLPKLNFPFEFQPKFRKNKDKFFIQDGARRSWLLLTPEEWVRQHWIHYFLLEKGIARSSMVVEKKVLLNGITKRIDLLITEKTRPKTLVECKATHVNLTEKNFDQTARYNSVIGAAEIILSNGRQHIFAKYMDGQYYFVESAL